MPGLAAAFMADQEIERHREREREREREGRKKWATDTHRDR